MDTVKDLIKHIQSLVPDGRKVKIMNVCGSHEHTIAFSGIRSVIPDNLELIPGPGCPVCVCPESDIINAIELSKREDVILVTYGDMLRVPSRKGSIMSEGKNFKMVTSPFEVLRQLKDGKARTSNVYKSVVKPEGNLQAQKIIDKFYEVADVNWRGIGYIPDSGLELRNEYADRDAKKVFELEEVKEKKISGCICGKVILGKAYPSGCKLFKKACSPTSPKGPCMVSIEGACNIWYKTGQEINN